MWLANVDGREACGGGGGGGGAGGGAFRYPWATCCIHGEILPNTCKEVMCRDMMGPPRTSPPPAPDTPHHRPSAPRFRRNAKFKNLSGEGLGTCPKNLQDMLSLYRNSWCNLVEFDFGGCQNEGRLWCRDGPHGPHVNRSFLFVEEGAEVCTFCIG